MKKLNPELISVVISPDNIYKDFLSWYRKIGTVFQCLPLTFISKNVVGDGIGLDAYSTFYQAMYSKFDGEFQKVPNQLLDKDGLQVIGKTIRHGYIYFEVFLLRLPKATLKQYLFSDVSNEELIIKFFEFLTSKEKQLRLSFGKENL